MWAQVLVRISVLAALACARPGSAAEALTEQDEAVAEQQSCADGSSCSVMGQAVQSSALLQMMDHTRRLHGHVQVKVKEALSFVVVEPSLAVCMTDTECDTDSCNYGTKECFENMCRHSISDEACGYIEHGLGGRYEGMQTGTECWNGNKSGPCASTYVNNEHGGATHYQARCATNVECQTHSCNEGMFEVQCLDNQCYHHKEDTLCEGKEVGSRYDGMQPETWCQNEKKTSRCHSSMEDANHSLASNRDAACFTDEDCATDDCSKTGFLNIGCSGRGNCNQGTTDCICQGERNGRRYSGMKPGTYCWDGRADGQCLSKMTEDTHLTVDAQQAVCHNDDDCQTETCNQPGLDNQGCIYGTCQHGRSHILCYRERTGFKYEGMQENTWCQTHRKTSFCDSNHEDTNFSSSTLQESLCVSIEDCQTESCNSSDIQFACESNQCKQKVEDPNCNNVRNYLAYTGMQPGSWCYSKKKYGFCTSKLEESNHGAAQEADSMCRDNADCRTDACDQANWTKQGNCYRGHCWHGNTDRLCQGQRDWSRYVGMQPDTWCRSNMKQGRCVSAVRMKPNFPVAASEAMCTNSHDCASRECNQGTLTNRGCRAGRCVNGALDPSCYGVANNERYMGQQEDTYCYSKYKESFCKARVEMTEPPTPAPPTVPPAPTPAPLISAAMAVEAQCATDTDCQTADCNQAPFVNHGCVQGKCNHGVEDPNCAQKGAGSTYWDMQGDTWCGEGGFKESLCKSQNMGDHRLTTMGCPTQEHPEGVPSCMLVDIPQRFACCDGGNSNGWSWTYTPCPAVEKTYAEAEEECRKNNLFVCTAEQLQSGGQCDAGCEFGMARAWTSTPCNPF